MSAGVRGIVTAVHSDGGVTMRVEAFQSDDGSISASERWGRGLRPGDPVQVALVECGRRASVDPSSVAFDSLGYGDNGTVCDLPRHHDARLHSERRMIAGRWTRIWWLR